MQLTQMRDHSGQRTATRFYSADNTSTHHYIWHCKQDSAKRDLSSQGQQQTSGHGQHRYRQPRRTGTNITASDDAHLESSQAMPVFPAPIPVAASWFLGALEGHVKQEILSLGAEHVNTPAKILTSSSRTLGGGGGIGAPPPWLRHFY